MTRRVVPLAIVAASLGAGVAAPAAASAQPVVVELFQSQGCSSCPPANANLMALADRSDILALSFGVTYWDQLGWKDTFASPRYTDRQWDYARAFHRAQVFTPEVVVNGRADVVGQDRGELEALIRREQTSGGPDIRLNGSAVTIGPGDGKAQIWLVRFDPRVVQVAIQRGENGGRTLPHRNVVKELTALGNWSGKPETLVLPPAADGLLRTAILVQDGAGGRILAAARD
jgi:hypothetical protein